MKVSIAFITICTLLSGAGAANWLRWIECPMMMCLDPCSECVESKTCITEPTTFIYFGTKCAGCPKLVSCTPPVDTLCCDPALKPKDVQCGLSGCTCCGGQWFTGNSGPTLEPGAVCKQLALPVTTVCGVQCGQIQCALGQECCNASCNVCAKPGDSCTQQVCYEEV
jgi:hypothetical protein